MYEEKPSAETIHQVMKSIRVRDPVHSGIHRKGEDKDVRYVADTRFKQSALEAQCVAA